ncbi:hypothetical protein D3C85_1120540 [compost metagenome]
MLKLVQLPWPRPVGHRNQGRQGQQLTLGVFHVIVVQPVGVVPKRSLNLSDDFVAASLDGEPVDLRFTEQGRQCSAQILHRHTHLGRLGTIDIHHDFRFVEGQVDIDERELAGFHGALFHPVHHLQQQLVVVGRVNHELEGQPLASARQ